MKRVMVHNKAEQFSSRTREEKCMTARKSGKQRSSKHQGPVCTRSAPGLGAVGTYRWSNGGSFLRFLFPVAS